ncbi:MAG TPA: DUF3224 domain-containing protein [Candidatus Kapabacteria bacterium]|jgi:hypothetical protein
MKATGSFTPTKWDENTTTQILDTQKITKASVELAFKGDEIEGVAAVEWMMFYRHADEKDQHKSSATYNGIIRFEGTLQGKAGSFVMEDGGTYDNGALNASLKILSDSGTGELAGISGTASYRSTPEGMSFSIDYQLS